MSKTQRIKGLLAPVVTPFDKDLNPDPARFIAHCKWLISQGSGLAAFGTNSEANSLSFNERIALLDSLLAESDSLRHFLHDRVITDRNGTLTVAELVEGYGAFCPERRWQPLPITEVHEKLEGLMLELFGVTKRHDIRRNDRNQRGYAGVRFLKEDEQSWGDLA